MNKVKDIFIGILMILSFAWIGMGIGIVIRSEVILFSVEGMKKVGMLNGIPAILLIIIFFATQSSRKERRELKKEVKRNKKMAKRERKQDKKDKKNKKRVIRKRKKKKHHKKVKNEMRRIKNKKITLKSKQAEQQLKTGNTITDVQTKNQLKQDHMIEALDSPPRNEGEEGNLEDNSIFYLNHAIQCEKKLIFKFKKFTDESLPVYLIIDDEYVFINLNSVEEACDDSKCSNRIPLECISRVLVLECEFPKVVVIRIVVKNSEEIKCQQDNSLEMMLVYDELEQGKQATKVIEQKLKIWVKESDISDFKI
ncbi:MAG: hypothetical protein ACRCST_00850 [Turicibacter sp.]